jgi:hypothetical protein
LAVVIVMLMPAPVLAEVCDKVVGEHWRRGDAPAWTYVSRSVWEFLLWLALPVLVAELIVLGILAILSAGYLFSSVRRVKLAACVCLAAYFVIVALFVFVDRVHPDYIMLGAAEEGCILVRIEWSGLGVPILFASLFAWLAFRLRRGVREAQLSAVQ